MSLIPGALYCQAVKSGQPTSPTSKKSLGELDQVKFVGNDHISSDELMAIISSKPTDKSLPHEIINYYAYYAFQNPSTPKYIKSSFSSVLKELAYEIKYFNEARADKDTGNIMLYYNRYGYHNAVATYKFTHDPKKRKNVLTFFITENARWKLSAVRYIGLENIPGPVVALINKVKVLDTNKPYKEIDVITEVSSINQVLVDNGYYYSKYDYPKASIDTLNMTDSLTIWFHTGRRQKIGAIDFIDSTRGQSLVSTPMKLKQLDFEKGDWFSLSNVQRSENNLRSLGTFDQVKIDTSTIFHSRSDTSLSFVAYLSYRKQQEYGLSPFINRSAQADMLNAGVEAAYTHRNFLSGAALVFNPFVRVTLLDLGRWLSGETKSEVEYQFGINLAQPLLWNWDVMRVGASSQPMISQRTISNYLRISTFSVPIKFPLKFPKFTIVNQGDFSVTWERQQPLNYASIDTLARDTSKSLIERTRIAEALTSYKNIDKYTKVNPGFFQGTALIWGINLTSDTRDNPFSPLRGHYVSFGFEAGTPPAIAQFYRAQAFFYQFWTASPQLVLAWKVLRIGNIWWNGSKSETYVPFERQFFAGGANSVRGWYSRQLRFIKDTSYSQAPYLEFIKDFVGSGTLIEGSFEARFRLAAPNTSGSSAGGGSSFLSSISIAPFFDYGNTFQWFLVNENNQFYEIDSFKDMISPNNWALAMGIGIRYETPVGPFRVDFGWPLRDPNDKVAPWIWQKTGWLSTVKFHIALGNPF